VSSPSRAIGGFIHLAEYDKTVLSLVLGVFFSKDRVEVVIEVQEPITISDMILNDKTVSYELLSCGRWMAGCPEGGKCM
jgi:hypothetical protein